MSGQMRWFGWGEPSHPIELPPAAEQMLRSELGVTGARTPPVALDEVRLPEVVAVPSGLADVVGAASVVTDREARIRHAAGRSYPDLVRLRSGDASGAPDAVVLPGSHDEVAEVISICDAEGVAVVPFGGGTSVVGGVEAVRGAFAAAVTLDLRRLDGIALDR
ncbi:MAG: FAD-binding protein, partial [Thermoleophilaceae bacterium]